jgi:hypothetical protein
MVSILTRSKSTQFTTQLFAFVLCTLQHCLQEKTLTVSTLSSHYRADECECKSHVTRVADMLRKVEPKICRLLQPRLQPVAANCTIPVSLWQHKWYGILPHVQHRLTLMRRAYREQGKFNGPTTEILLKYWDQLFVFSYIWSLYIADNTTISNNMTISLHKSIVHSLINVHRTNSSVAHCTLMINFTILKHYTIFLHGLPTKSLPCLWQNFPSTIMLMLSPVLNCFSCRTSRYSKGRFWTK